MGYQTVRALVPIRHSGVLRIPGQTTGDNKQDFVAEDSQVARLVALGFVTSLGVAPDPTPNPVQASGTSDPVPLDVDRALGERDRRANLSIKANRSVTVGIDGVECVIVNSSDMPRTFTFSGTNSIIVNGVINGTVTRTLPPRGRLEISVDAPNSYNVPDLQAGGTSLTRTPYWGPITAKSSMPKSTGSWRYQYGCVSYVMYEGGNVLRIPYIFAYGQGESLKALTEAFTQGSATVYGSVVVNGNVRPMFQLGTKNRLGSCQFGDVVVMECDLGAYHPPGTEVWIKNVVSQTSHNDPNGFAAGQFFFYSNPEIGKDILCSRTSDPGNGSWEAVADSADVTAIPPTASNVGALGYRPWTVLGLTTRPTVFIAGDSREQSGDRNANSNIWWPLGVDGSQGESCRTYARLKIGCVNAGISAEKGYNLTSLSHYAARSKGASWCSVLQFGYGTNELDDTALTTAATSLARMREIKDQWLSLLVQRDPANATKHLRMKTINTKINASSDYYTTLTGQSRGGNAYGFVIRGINQAIRCKALGNQSFFEAHAGVTTGMDSGFVVVHPNARIVNTGTGTITVDTTTGLTSLVWSASVFQPSDDGKRIVIAGAGASAAILRCTMLYVSATTVYLIRLDSNSQPSSFNASNNGWPPQIPASSLNEGASPLALTGSTNILYLQAERVMQDGIHYTAQGEAELADWNVTRGVALLP